MSRLNFGLDSLDGLKHPLASSNAKKYFTISPGVASAVPSQDFKPSNLIKQADEALYRAKNRAKQSRIALEPDEFHSLSITLGTGL